MKWDWHSEGQDIAIINIRGETKDTLVGEGCVSAVDEHEGEVAVNLSCTITEVKGISQVLTSELDWVAHLLVII
jgi:hypothetical protein